MYAPLDSESNPTKAITAFKEWMCHHGGKLHDNVDIFHDERRGFHLRVRDHSSLDPCDVVLAIDMVHTISSAQARLPRQDAWPEDFLQRWEKTRPEVIGRFELMRIYLRGTQDEMWPYVRMLVPPTRVHELNTPIFWSEGDKEWIKGTNVEASIQPRVDRWRDEFETTTEIFEANGFTGYEDPNLYLWAASIFASRAFSSRLFIPKTAQDRNYFSYPILVPILDLLSHDPFADISLRSSNTLNGGPAFRWVRHCQLIVGRPLKGGQEVTIKYDDNSNSELLMGYGFVIPDNPYDAVEVSCMSATGKRYTGRLRRVEIMSNEGSEQVIRPDPQLQWLFEHTLRMLSMRRLFTDVLNKSLARIRKESLIADKKTPRNEAQKLAKAYRETQIGLLQNNLEALKVARTLDHNLELTIEDVLSTFAPDHDVQFRRLLLARLGTRVAEKIIQNGDETAAFIYWFCMLWAIDPLRRRDENPMSSPARSRKRRKLTLEKASTQISPSILQPPSNSGLLEAAGQGAPLVDVESADQNALLEDVKSASQNASLEDVKSAGQPESQQDDPRRTIRFHGEDDIDLQLLMNDHWKHHFQDEVSGEVFLRFSNAVRKKWDLKEIVLDREQEEEARHLFEGVELAARGTQGWGFENPATWSLDNVRVAVFVVWHFGIISDSVENNGRKILYLEQPTKPRTVPNPTDTLTHVQSFKEDTPLHPSSGKK